METIWFKSRKERKLTGNIERILRKWQLALKEYEQKVRRLGYNDLGYDTTEKANFGFFLWGCAQLKMPFILEYTTKGKWRDKGEKQRRPDAWIWIDINNCALIEVKMLWDNLRTLPAKKNIKRKIDLLREELKSIRNEDEKAKLIGLCFVALWINKKFWAKDRKLRDAILERYLDNLEHSEFIDFFGVYRPLPDELACHPDNIAQDKWITPAVVLLGKIF